MRFCGQVGLGCVVALTLAGGARLRAQDRDDTRWREECERQEHGEAHFCDIRIVHLSAAGGQLSVDNDNGGTEVVGWNGDSIVVHERIRARASSEEEARQLASEVRVSTTGNHISADGPATWHRREWSVDYRIFVPAHYNVSLDARNGPVSVEGVNGHIQLDAINGPISLDRLGGDVHARARNGPLDVTLSGTKWDGAGLDAETQNGPVDLSIPAQYSAHLETSTVNGPMEVDFPITIQGRLDPRRLDIDLGSGGPTVRVTTVNGPLTVKKD